MFPFSNTASNTSLWLSYSIHSRTTTGENSYYCNNLFPQNFLCEKWNSSWKYSHAASPISRSLAFRSVFLQVKRTCFFWVPGQVFFGGAVREKVIFLLGSSSMLKPTSGTMNPRSPLHYPKIHHRQWPRSPFTWTFPDDSLTYSVFFFKLN